MRLTKCKLFLALALVLAMTTGAFAAASTWKGVPAPSGTYPEWTGAKNWLGGVPGASSAEAIFATPVPVYKSVVTANATSDISANPAVGNFTVKKGDTALFEITVGNGTGAQQSLGALKTAIEGTNLSAKTTVVAIEVELANGKTNTDTTGGFTVTIYCTDNEAITVASGSGISNAITGTVATTNSPVVNSADLTGASDAATLATLTINDDAEIKLGADLGATATKTALTIASGKKLTLIPDSGTFISDVITAKPLADGKVVLVGAAGNKIKLLPGASFDADPIISSSPISIDITDLVAGITNTTLSTDSKVTALLNNPALVEVKSGGTLTAANFTVDPAKKDIKSGDIKFSVKLNGTKLLLSADISVDVAVEDTTDKDTTDKDNTDKDTTDKDNTDKDTTDKNNTTTDNNSNSEVADVTVSKDIEVTGNVQHKPSDITLKKLPYGLPKKLADKITNKPVSKDTFIGGKPQKVEMSAPTSWDIGGGQEISVKDKVKNDKFTLYAAFLRGPKLLGYQIDVPDTGDIKFDIVDYLDNNDSVIFFFMLKAPAKTGSVTAAALTPVELTLGDDDIVTEPAFIQVGEEAPSYPVGVFAEDGKTIDVSKQSGTLKLTAAWVYDYVTVELSGDVDWSMTEDEDSLKSSGTHKENATITLSSTMHNGEHIVTAKGKGKVEAESSALTEKELKPQEFTFTVEGGQGDPGSSGGCAAGFTGLALLLAIPMFLKKK